MNFVQKLRALFRREKLDAEMADELRAHVELQTRENIARGMAPDDARFAAQRSFGGVEQIKERCRDERWRGVRWLEQFSQDVRYAVRGLVRQPGFAAVAVISLALGIGANTAIFSLLDAVLWKMLPVRAPEALVFLERYPVRSGVPGLPGRKFPDISAPLMHALVERAAVIEGATTYRGETMHALIDGESEPVKGLRVAKNFYEVLGVDAAQGRMIRSADTDGDNLLVLSHGYWLRRFGGRPIVGSSIALNGKLHTVIGVAAREFFGVETGATFEVSVPMSTAELAPNPGVSVADPSASPLTSVLARLRPGVTIEQANLALTALLRQLVREAKLPDVTSETLAQHRIEAQPASRGLDRLRLQFSKPLLAVTVLVALVLLITCVNLANLQLARAAARQRELAIRLAIGAGRGRLMRQMLTESLLLALVGAAAGLGVAQAASQALLRLAASGSRPIAVEAPLDLRVLGFTLVAGVGTGLLFGLVPAWIASGGGVGAIFGRAAHKARPTSRIGQALVVAQVALSLVLLVGAGLFGRSFQKLAETDTGFQRENVLLVSLDPRLAGRRGAELALLYERVLARVTQLPGVVSASFERNIPLSGASTIGSYLPAGFTPPAGPDGVIWTESVGPRYFETLGLRLRSGRDFRDTDNRQGPRVVAINETAARLFFGQQNPVGLRIGGASNRAEFEIVAVVGDTQHATVRERMRATVYLPLWQDPGVRETTLLLRTVSDPGQVAPLVRAALRDVDPTLPVMGVTTLEAVVARSLIQDRLTATLGGCFSVLALLLVGVGLAGLLSFAVSRRTNEIGLRMALGAGRAQVVGMIVREALWLAGLGVALGLPCALVVARSAQSLLFGLSPADPLTLAIAIALLGGVALVAAFWPARRAAKVDPIVALRCD